MSTCQRTEIVEIDLPAEFEDLRGLLHADLEAILSMVTQRAQERLMLTRREAATLQARLWNGMAGAINEAVEPLSAELR